MSIEGHLRRHEMDLSARRMDRVPENPNRGSTEWCFRGRTGKICTGELAGPEAVVDGGGQREETLTFVGAKGS